MGTADSFVAYEHVDLGYGRFIWRGDWATVASNGTQDEYGTDGVAEGTVMERIHCINVYSAISSEITPFSLR